MNNCLTHDEPNRSTARQRTNSESKKLASDSVKLYILLLAAAIPAAGCKKDKDKKHEKPASEAV